MVNLLPHQKSKTPGIAVPECKKNRHPASAPPPCKGLACHTPDMRTPRLRKKIRHGSTPGNIYPTEVSNPDKSDAPIKKRTILSLNSWTKSYYTQMCKQVFQFYSLDGWRLTTTLGKSQSCWVRVKSQTRVSTGNINKHNQYPESREHHSDVLLSEYKVKKM